MAPRGCRSNVGDRVHLDKLAPPNELRVQHAAACNLHELPINGSCQIFQVRSKKLSRPGYRSDRRFPTIAQHGMGRLKGRVSLSSGTTSLIFPLRLSRKRKAALAA
jgi:hypothetical protein